MKNCTSENDTLYDLITKARGSRNIRDFAAEIGIPSTTITRIKGGVLPRLSTIQKIADKAGNGISSDDLMSAWYEAKSQQESKDNDVNNDELLELQHTITRKLMENGYSVREQRPKETSVIEFEILTDALTFGSELSWRFKFANSAKNAADLVLSTCGAYYLGAKPSGRISIVVHESETFERMKSLFERVSARDQISIIYVESSTKVDEFIIPIQDGNAPNTPFVNQAPVIEDDDIQFDVEEWLKLL